jgi:tripartite-type tricarboxylate transporter receptor subunit TctC
MRAIACVVALTGIIGSVHAQAPAYSSRPITFVVASAPGGTTDFTARLLADLLSKDFKQME